MHHRSRNRTAERRRTAAWVGFVPVSALGSIRAVWRAGSGHPRGDRRRNRSRAERTVQRGEGGRRMGPGRCPAPTGRRGRRRWVSRSARPSRAPDTAATIGRKPRKFGGVGVSDGRSRVFPPRPPYRGVRRVLRTLSGPRCRSRRDECWARIRAAFERVRGAGRVRLDAEHPGQHANSALVEVVAPPLPRRVGLCEGADRARHDGVVSSGLSPNRSSSTPK
jgi:hypothetical protein